MTVPDCEARWITIIYTQAGKFRVLHLIAPSIEVFNLWRDALQQLYDQRKKLMSGLDHMRKRQFIWLKQHWSNADANRDDKLNLHDVSMLCRNLNINASEADVKSHFLVSLYKHSIHIQSL